MSFLQLVLSLDKTIKEIILLWRICQFDRYRNISLSLKNEWMFVMSVIAQLVLGGVFCGNQSNCRICSLIEECWNGVDSLEILEHCRIAWRGWKVMNDWNVCKTHGCISRRSPCLLCIEFLFWSEGLFALWNVVVVLMSSLSSVCRIGFWMENSLDCSVMCTCRIGAGIGAWRIL